MSWVGFSSGIPQHFLLCFSALSAASSCSSSSWEQHWTCCLFRCPNGRRRRSCTLPQVCCTRIWMSTCLYLKIHKQLWNSLNLVSHWSVQCVCVHMHCNNSCLCFLFNRYLYQGVLSVLCVHERVQQAGSNNNDGYLECLTHTGPKYLHIR